MLERRRGRRPMRRSSLGDALALPFADEQLRTRVHELLLLPPRGSRAARFLAEARRVAPSWSCVGSRRGAARERDERWEERVLNDGSRWQVYKRVFDPAALADELGGGEVLHAGRWFVVVRSTRDPPACHLSLARLAEARPARLPRVRRGRLPARVVAGDRARHGGQRAYLFGQAPGVVEGEERLPWRGRAGQTLRRWLELDEESSTRRSIARR